MKKKIKIIIDIIMFIGFMALMGYPITDNFIHEILGTVIFVLLIAHNILNMKWYTTLLKGKHDTRRNFHIAINLLLLISFLLTIVSGIMMSRSLYTFMNIGGVALARKMHLVANSWTFVLISIHLGLHLTPMRIKAEKSLKSSNFEYVVYLTILIFLLSGIYLFITEKIGEDMIGMTKFKAFNYNENPVVFYLKYFVMAITIAIITNSIQSKKILINKEENEK